MAYPKDWKEEPISDSSEPPKQQEMVTKTCSVCGIKFETAKNGEPICSGCWLEKNRREGGNNG